MTKTIPMQHTLSNKFMPSQKMLVRNFDTWTKLFPLQRHYEFTLITKEQAQFVH